MRNAASLFASAVVFALFSTGCSSFVPFTHELRTQHRLTDDEVKNLQFYSSHKIMLRREVQSEERQVTGHKLKLVSGKNVEEVVIPEKTPGVAMKVSAHTISVSFVTGTLLDFTVRSARLPLESFGDFVQPFAVAEGSFRPRPTVSPAFIGQQFAQPPNPFPGQAQIAGDSSNTSSASPLDDLSGNYFLAVESSGQIPFGGRMWEAVGDTVQAYLLIDADKLEETEEKRTVLPGVRLGN